MQWSLRPPPRPAFHQAVFRRARISLFSVCGDALAAAEAEAGEGDAEKSERGRFGRLRVVFVPVTGSSAFSSKLSLLSTE
jgi:hypothetical protein